MIVFLPATMSSSSTTSPSRFLTVTKAPHGPRPSHLSDIDPRIAPTLVYQAFPARRRLMASTGDERGKSRIGV